MFQCGARGKAKSERVASCKLTPPGATAHKSSVELHVWIERQPIAPTSPVEHVRDCTQDNERLAMTTRAGGEKLNFEERSAHVKPPLLPIPSRVHSNRKSRDKRPPGAIAAPEIGLLRRSDVSSLMQ
jgi:hypothetical protein